MKRLNARILIKTKGGTGDLFQFFSNTNTVEISESHEDLTSTAKVTIGRNVRLNGGNDSEMIFGEHSKGIQIIEGIKSVFRIGDKIQIDLGYGTSKNTKRTNIFLGYISNMSLNAPAIIECEDSMYVLKHKMINWPVIKKGDTKITTIKLKKLIEDVLLKDTGFKLVMSASDIDMEVNVIRFDNCSSAQALDKIKDTFKGLYVYFKTNPNHVPELHVGFLNDVSNSPKIKFSFDDASNTSDFRLAKLLSAIGNAIVLPTPIIDDSKLRWRWKDDIKLRIRASSWNPLLSKTEPTSIIQKNINGTPATISTGGNPIIVEIGDFDGTHADIFTTKFIDSNSLIQFATKWLESKKYDGYGGSFTTFGEPIITPGDRAELNSFKFPEKDGIYMVQSVTRTFGFGGYRQEVQIGQKVG